MNIILVVEDNYTSSRYMTSKICRFWNIPESHVLDFVNLQDLSSIFQEDESYVVCCVNGKAAIDFTSKDERILNAIKLILMDYDMPEMRGDDALGDIIMRISSENVTKVGVILCSSEVASNQLMSDRVQKAGKSTPCVQIEKQTFVRSFNKIIKDLRELNWMLPEVFSDRGCFSTSSLFAISGSRKRSLSSPATPGTPSTPSPLSDATTDAGSLDDSSRYFKKL